MSTSNPVQVNLNLIDGIPSLEILNVLSEISRDLILSDQYLDSFKLKRIGRREIRETGLPADSIKDEPDISDDQHIALNKIVACCRKYSIQNCKSALILFISCLLIELQELTVEQSSASLITSSEGNEKIKTCFLDQFEEKAGH